MLGEEDVNGDPLNVLRFTSQVISHPQWSSVTMGLETRMAG